MARDRAAELAAKTKQTYANILRSLLMNSANVDLSVLEQNLGSGYIFAMVAG